MIVAATKWMVLVKAGVMLAVIPVGALLFTYGFLKMIAHMQSRLGPMEAGGWHGWAQLIADALKFLQKEDIVPSKVDRWVFYLAPALPFSAVFLVFMTVPFGPDLNIVNLDSQVFVTLAVSSIGTIGVLMAGWSSANKYSLMGGFRGAGQLMAYELPLILSVIAVVMMAGTMRLGGPDGIVAAQGNFKVLGTVPLPFVFPQIVAFVVFLIAAQAELAQAPFDMPLAESELVSGYATEYSGWRYLFFYLAEFTSNIAMAAIAATLFLGGYWVPGVHGPIANIVGPIALIVKTAALVFFFFWLRITYPRLREDQLQRFAWKYLIPVSLANIAVTGILKIAFK